MLQPPPWYIGIAIPKPVTQVWAPAWFYSALNWLGKRYYDASNVPQAFAAYLAGSTVDPYANLGVTRLFMVFLVRNTLRLTLAADTNSNASTSGGKIYANSDQGILAMYQDLAASAIFSAVNYCYIPGTIGPDLDANASVGIGNGGYDPATGLRTVVLGSAVSQVVPLADFLQTHNEQIYDDSPTIVPFSSALVYNVAQYNVVGATSFVLPVYYARDQVSTGNYYVSKFDASVNVNGASVHCGPDLTDNLYQFDSE